jgi:hypothetical protein
MDCRGCGGELYNSLRRKDEGNNVWKGRRESIMKREEE